MYLGLRCKYWCCLLRESDTVHSFEDVDILIQYFRRDFECMDSMPIYWKLTEGIGVAMSTSNQMERNCLHHQFIKYRELVLKRKH
jgi:hypothetical protein